MPSLPVAIETGLPAILLAKPEQVMDQIKLDERTAVILMTHNYNYDLALLRLLAGRPMVYTGMLGPRKKLERMLDALRETGIELTAAQMSAIHSPVGLNIGAETPEEIALSILAEIKSVFAAAKAIPLKDHTTAIHSRSALAIPPLKLSEK